MTAIDDIDLASLAASLRDRFADRPPVGYLRGRTVLRDAIVERVGCSALEAEELVDTLEARGFVSFDGDPRARAVADAPWAFRP